MRTLLILVFGALLTGCATQYPNSLEKNLTVRLKLQKNSGFLTSANAIVNVSEIGKDCSLDDQGYVDLVQGDNQVGLPLGRPVLVTFKVAHSGPASSSSVETGAVLTPKAGARYLGEANYVDAMYSFRLYEVTSGGKKALPVMETVPGCKK